MIFIHRIWLAMWLSFVFFFLPASVSAYSSGDGQTTVYWDTLKSSGITISNIDSSSGSEAEAHSTYGPSSGTSSVVLPGAGPTSAAATASYIGAAAETTASLLKATSSFYFPFPSKTLIQSITQSGQRFLKWIALLLLGVSLTFRRWKPALS